MVDVKIENGLLAADNVLHSIVAAFLNETGQPIHIEPSFTVVVSVRTVGTMRIAVDVAHRRRPVRGAELRRRFTERHEP